METNEKRHAAMGEIAEKALNNERKSWVIPPGRFRADDVVVLAIDMSHAEQCGGEYAWLTEEMKKAVSGGALTVAGTRKQICDLVAESDSEEALKFIDAVMNSDGSRPLVLTIVGSTVCFMGVSMHVVSSMGGDA